ncbi:hypothetical protein F4778DRAFT_785888 [Xylariomycetidae sp. FL2044]|nr:hypothetical protein F4778DRAFT_785888 [Xylariomycetidae sp. FL2044]
MRSHSSNFQAKSKHSDLRPFKLHRMARWSESWAGLSSDLNSRDSFHLRQKKGQHVKAREPTPFSRLEVAGGFSRRQSLREYLNKLSYENDITDDLSTIPRTRALGFNTGIRALQDLATVLLDQDLKVGAGEVRAGGVTAPFKPIESFPRPLHEYMSVDQPLDRAELLSVPLPPSSKPAMFPPQQFNDVLDELVLLSIPEAAGCATSPHLPWKIRIDVPMLQDLPHVGLITRLLLSLLRNCRDTKSIVPDLRDTRDGTAQCTPGIFREIVQLDEYLPLPHTAAQRRLQPQTLAGIPKSERNYMCVLALTNNVHAEKTDVAHHYTTLSNGPPAIITPEA